MDSPLHLRARVRCLATAGSRSRCTLGAAALAAIAVAGCGTAGDPSGRDQAALRTANEQHLLKLIATARADAAANDGAGVESTLSQFVAQVKTLRSSGALSVATATALDRRAVETGRRAAQQLPPAVRVTDADTVDTAGRSVSAAAATPQATPSAPPQTSPAPTQTPSTPPQVPPASTQTPSPSTQPPASTTPAAPSPMQQCHHRQGAHGHPSRPWHHGGRGGRSGASHQGGSGNRSGSDCSGSSSTWTAWSGGNHS